MKLAIITQKYNTIQEGPDNWPWQIIECEDTDTVLPSVEWKWYTVEEYNLLIETEKDNYEIWKNSTLSKDRYPVIYKYIYGSVINSHIPYEQVYTILGLHKIKKNLFKGLFTGFDYYGQYNADTDEYSELVLTEDIDYTFDTDNFLKTRTLTITWYDQYGQAYSNNGEQKITTKTYSRLDAIKYGKLRRENVIDTLISEISTYLHELIGNLQIAENIGQTFVTSLQNEIDAYIKTNDSILYSTIENISVESASFINNEIVPNLTIREFILEQLRPPY